MNYFFTGYPLSGKSTLAKALAGATGRGYMSTGDLARSLGMGLEPSIATHDLSIVHNAEIVAAAIGASLAGKVVDGFPRSIEQVGALRGAELEFMVIFVVENPVEIYERISERARKEGRPEDSVEVVVGRLRRSIDFGRELEESLCPGELLVVQGSIGLDCLVRKIEDAAGAALYRRKSRDE